MKRLLITLTIILCVCMASPAIPAEVPQSRTYKVFLHKSLDTGVSTAQGETVPTVGTGVSLVVLSGHGKARSSGTYEIDTRGMHGSWTFQLSEVSPSQAALAAGDYSGATFTLWARTTIDTDMWNSGNTYVIFDEVALSGDTTIAVDITPSSLWGGTSVFAARAMRLELYNPGKIAFDGLTGTLYFQPWR